MLFALAILLIQPRLVPQMSYSAQEIALFQPVAEASFSYPSPTAIAMEVESADTEVSAQPALSAEAALPAAPEPAPVATPVTMAFLKTAKPGTISVSDLRSEQRRKERIWMGLGFADHAAATFDAWSTRRAISQYGARELNPMLRPFAGNASLYVAIQVGPALMDYVGKKMMYSRHPLLRRMWWIPQSASFASSLFCGAHNVVVR